MAKQQNLEETVNSIIDVAMERLRDIVDVNTVVGEIVNVNENVSVLPICRVSVGFVAGGGELSVRNKNKNPKEPFAGGSGSGFVVTPIGFLVIENGVVRYISCEEKSPLNEVVKFSNNLVNKIVSDKKETHNEKRN